MSKILRKYETVTDLMVYEVDLTDEQAKLFEEDEDNFFDTVDLDWEFRYDKVGDPEAEHKIVED
jgi:hypothetical protein